MKSRVTEPTMHPNIAIIQRYTPVVARVDDAVDGVVAELDAVVQQVALELRLLCARERASKAWLLGDSLDGLLLRRPRTERTAASSNPINHQWCIQNKTQ